MSNGQCWKKTNVIQKNMVAHVSHEHIAFKLNNNWFYMPLEEATCGTSYAASLMPIRWPSMAYMHGKRWWISMQVEIDGMFLCWNTIRFCIYPNGKDNFCVIVCVLHEASIYVRVVATTTTVPANDRRKKRILRLRKLLLKLRFLLLTLMRHMQFHWLRLLMRKQLQPNPMSIP